ncbi:MAG: ABC transporter ATP-binding protein [Chloroflexaceae bacterium]|nr:ABC transporter ATP-binding protein [Chloroflexaceae bacterium]
MGSIRFEHVYKRFGDFTALTDLNLHIEDQEFLVLVGPSGCGKTTALRCLAGLEEISQGAIYLGDRMVNHLPPKDRDIAMVFQSYALYPHMSVYDNLAFSLRLRSRTSLVRKLLALGFHRAAYHRIKATEADIDRRVRNAAAILDIEHLLGRKPKVLSGGQRQRVALGRAMVRNPRVFLMDEPLSNLDAKLRVQTRTEISKLHQRLKTTFIYVTHDQTEAMTMGSRIAVMRDGVVQQLDVPQRLYDHPSNQFVAGFIGSPAMNFFEAQVSRTEEGWWFHIPNLFTLPIPAEKAAPLGAYAGETVIFGIRPEDLHDPQHLPAGVNTEVRIRATVEVMERMGSEIYVYFEKGGREFVGRFDPRVTLQRGDQVEAVIDMEKMHAFDRTTGEAIATRA